MVGQGLQVAVAPVLTRLYGPADFGSFAVLVALVSVLGVVTTLRLEVAVVLPTDEDDAVALVWAAAASALAVSVGMALAGLVVSPGLGELLGTPTLPRLWWLVAAASLSVGLFQILSAWLARHRDYAALGARNLVLGVVTAAGQLTMGVLGVGLSGLSLGHAGGYLTGALGSGEARRLARRRPSAARLRAVVRRYRRFPLVSSWSALINSVGQQAPVLVVSAMYGQVVVGLLGLTIRVLAAPAAVVGRAVTPVFMGEIGARARDDGPSMTRQILRTTLVLTALGLGPALVLVVAGPWLFSTVFGPEWVEAGVLSRLLAVGYLAQFAVSPVSQTLLILEMQVTSLVWDVLRLVLMCGVPFAVAVSGAGPRSAVASLAVVQVLVYLALLGFCLRAARIHDRADRRQPAVDG